MDHVHMLVEIPPKMSVSGFVGYLKGKSSQMIFERWANARFKYRNRSLLTLSGDQPQKELPEYVSPDSSWYSAYEKGQVEIKD